MSWRVQAFRLYFSGHSLLLLAAATRAVAIGWEIYDRTGSALHLGYAGLASFLPSLMWSLVAGYVTDTVNRKHVFVVSIAVNGLASLALALNSSLGGSVYLIYACLIVNGTARIFSMAARTAFLPRIVPAESFSNAVAWTSAGIQLASVAGPPLGGLLIAWSGHATLAYVVSFVAQLLSVGLLSGIVYEHRKQSRAPMTRASVSAGFRLIWSTRLLLAVMLLDMFSVLLGGATAMLPVYAKDVLQIGPDGLGWLTMAPAVGALTLGFVQAHRRPERRAGWSILLAVIGFGAATILFGLSRHYALSMAMLFLVGACTNLTFVVRHSMVRRLTPDDMLGRVSAVNGLFMGTANELGAFESGLVASWFGPIVAVVSGGVGTMAVAAAIAWLFPELRGYGGVDEPPPELPPPRADGGQLDSGPEAGATLNRTGQP